MGKHKLKPLEIISLGGGVQSTALVLIELFEPLGVSIVIFNELLESTRNALDVDFRIEIFENWLANLEKKGFKYERPNTDTGR